MNKITKMLLAVILIMVTFSASFFGMYKYGQYKNFNDLIKQGNQYMLQKNYDKAIQSFKQALTYKDDKETQNNLLLAESLKGKRTTQDTISKDLQLASDAAKNNNYDGANKYLDEVLKIDPSNSQATDLKSAYTKTIQAQQEKAAQEQQAEVEKQNQQVKMASMNSNVDTEGITSQQAYNIAVNHFKTFDISPEGEYIDSTNLPKGIVNNFYLFYSEDKSDHSANDFAIGINKMNGSVVFVYPDGTIRYPN